jgi:hypothetical protein
MYIVVRIAIILIGMSKIVYLSAVEGDASHVAEQPVLLPAEPTAAAETPVSEEQPTPAQTQEKPVANTSAAPSAVPSQPTPMAEPQKVSAEPTAAVQAPVSKEPTPASAQEKPVAAPGESPSAVSPQPTPMAEPQKEPAEPTTAQAPVSKEPTPAQTQEKPVAAASETPAVAAPSQATPPQAGMHQKALGHAASAAGQPEGKKAETPTHMKGGQKKPSTAAPAHPGAPAGKKAKPVAQVPSAPAHPAAAKQEKNPAPTSAPSQPAAPAAAEKVEPEQAPIPVPVAQQAPSMPEEKPVMTEEEKETAPPTIDEAKGIDTVDLEEPRGNWLFKKIWWERAEQKYEKIRETVANIQESRMGFFAKRSQLEKDLLEPFYLQAGLGQGELQEIVNTFIKLLEKDRAQEGDLNEQERTLFNTLTEEKNTLEQLSKDIELIAKLDADIDDTLTKLLEQINRARKYEQEAWSNFKEIARVLSDTKARELFYKIDTAWRNVKDIREYIEQTIALHFDQVTTTVQQQVERVKAAMQGLKAKDIDLKDQVERLTSEPHTKPKEIEEPVEEPEPQGWISSLWNNFTTGLATVFDYTTYAIQWPFIKLMGLFGFGTIHEEEETKESSEEEKPVAAPVQAPEPKESSSDESEKE